MLKTKEDPTYEGIGLDRFMVRHLQPVDRKFQTAEDFAGTHLDKSIVSDKIYDVRSDKIKVSPLDISNIKTLEIYYLGLISAAITGGALDGVTYSYYILDVFVHHNFSTDFQNNVPFYMVWGYYQTTAGNTQYANELVGINTTGGAQTTAKYHQSYLFGGTPHSEYVLFRWIMTRTSGTVTIPAQTIDTQLAILYSRYTDTVGATPPQGGGGGILYEQVDIYI